MRYKVKSVDIIVGLVYFLAALAISMSGYAAGEFELVHKISNGFLSSNAMSIKGGPYEFREYSDNLMNGNILYLKYDYNISAVYSNNEFSISVISGRSFMPDDFKDPSPKAIAGKNIELRVSKDGKNYYHHNGIDYEIIGIMGLKKISRLDNSVFLCTFGNPDTEGADIVIDGTRVEENVRLLQSRLGGLKALSLEEAGIGRIFASNIISFKTIFTYVGLIFLFSLFSITCFWVMQKQKLILILKIFGISRINILKTVGAEYSKYALLSFAAGVVIAYIFLRPMFSFQSSIINNLVYAITGMLCCLVPAFIFNLRWANQSMGRYWR